MARLIPPVNYGMVEDNLYRSGLPNELNFPFLEQLKLRTIIYLAPDDPDEAFVSFIKTQDDIRLVQLGNSGRQKLFPLDEDTVLQALDVILDPSNYPLYIMCQLGRHRTGSVVGCLRKLQRWHLSSVFEEYRRYSGKVRLQNEQFIELFDTDLVNMPAPEARQHLPWL